MCQFMTIKISGFDVYNFLHHSGGRLAARIGKKKADTDVGNGHGILIGAAYRRAYMDEYYVISRLLDPRSSRISREDHDCRY